VKLPAMPCASANNAGIVILAMKAKNVTAPVTATTSWGGLRRAASAPSKRSCATARGTTSAVQPPAAWAMRAPAQPVRQRADDKLGASEREQIGRDGELDDAVVDVLICGQLGDRLDMNRQGQRAHCGQRAQQRDKRRARRRRHW
jgi:hypothetical protein